MKQSNVIFLAAGLLSGIAGFSQAKIPQTRAQLLKTLSASKLNWYATAMKKLALKDKTSSGSVVLNSKTEGGNRTEIGIGLTGSESGFTPQGSPRQESGGNSVCTYQNVRVNYATSRDFNLFDPNSSIYPGQFFSINSILNGSFAPASTPPRKNYQLGMSIFNPNAPGEGILTVTDMTRNPQQEIQRQLLAPNFSASIPAQGIMEMSEITSSTMLKAKFESSSGIFLPLEQFGIPANIAAGTKMSADGSNSVKETVYMLNFIQPMYTLNLLTNHDALFQSANAHTSLTNAAYVESVTYGRRIVITIASESNITRIKAALSAALSAEIGETTGTEIEVGVKASGEAATELRKIAKTFYAKIYGGEGSVAGATFYDIIDFKNAFKQYMSSPSASRFSENTGALPLHYTMRRISDGALLSVRSIGSFDELVSCNTSKYKVEIQYTGFTVNKVVEGPPDSEEDIYGTFKLASVTTNGTTTPKNMILKENPKDRAISKGAGKKDEDDVTIVAMNNVNETNIRATTLNFHQKMHDWEFTHEPTYREESSAELKFNFATVADEISALAPGGSKTFSKNIKLEESGPLGVSKITLHVKIKVTKG